MDGGDDLVGALRMIARNRGNDLPAPARQTGGGLCCAGRRGPGRRGVGIIAWSGGRGTRRKAAARRGDSRGLGSRQRRDRSGRSEAGGPGSYAGARVGGRVAPRRQAPLRAGGRPAHQPGGRGRTPGERHGHVVRESGLGGGARRAARARPGQGGAPHPARARRRHRAVEARRHGSGHRHAHARAAEVSRIVGDGDLSPNVIQVRVAHLGLDRTTNTPVVILQEQEGERVLPIWIGPAEASAIAMELAGVKFARPLTHDLLKQVILGLGADLRKVIITQVKDNTYYAELHIYRGDAVIQIDARPSDSIAVALRLKAPIFTSESLLALTSVETGEAGGESGTTPLDPDALKTYLQNLDPEDFGKFTP